MPKDAASCLVEDLALTWLEGHKHSFDCEPSGARAQVQPVSLRGRVGCGRGTTGPKVAKEAPGALAGALAGAPTPRLPGFTLTIS